MIWHMREDILTQEEVLKALDRDDGITLNRHIRARSLQIWDEYLIEMDGWPLEKFMVDR